jgi:hypothetical protein
VGVLCVVRGTNNEPYGIEVGVSGFRALGGVFRGDPSCAGPDNGVGLGMIVCAARGTDNSLYDTAF